ncbi:MAG: hypothetical protein ABJF10_25090 [Chthoniobacter sp.]|uniref:hypothetical protein n=1 Tax=Chthoniobacter sp. TaxID=2510640 RepID=UPI0032A80605
MLTQTNCRRSAAGAFLACALFIVVASANQGLAAAQSGVSLTGAAAEIQSITGGPIEIHVTPPLSVERALPLVDRTVVEAFRDAAKDPETKERLNRIVHVIVIEGWFAGGEIHHVKLKNEVMTIQTLTDREDIEDLRPLIVEVLKKVAQLDAKRTP